MIPNRTALGKATDAVVVENLRKSFPVKGGTLEAVRGIDLRVAPGEIFGFLGPNGAGKTTTLRMLSTLLPPTSGRARVAGCDLLREPQQVRERKELVFQGRCYGMSSAEATRRAAELISTLDLESCANRPAGSYSGGQG